MRAHKPNACLGSLILFAWLAAATSAQEKDRVMRSVPSAKLESILQELKIRYEKKSDPKNDAINFYDFERNSFKVRLHNYNGRDLWLDVHFTDKITLEDVNQWNVRAKFSRAVLLKEGDKQSTSLEAQLDCDGGVTDGMIRQFILRFDGELKSFVQFLTK